MIYINDYHNQNVSFDNNLPIMAEIFYPATNQTIHLTPDYQQSTFFEFLASNITLPPVLQNDTFYFIATYNGFSSKIIIDIFTRACLPGEEYDELTLSCNLCPENYFSLNVNESCQKCPSGSSCPGGNFIDVAEGYWRDPGSSNVYQCLNDSVDRCMGGYYPEIQCQVGYSGALCQGCNFTEGYGPDSAFTCSKCDDDLFILILDNAAGFIFAFAYELITYYLAYKSNKALASKSKMITPEEKKKDEQNIVLSQQLLVLNTFLQILYILISYISDIEFSLVRIIDKLQFFFALASIQPQQISSIECLLMRLGVNPSNVTYAKIIFQILLPFFKILFVITILFLKNIRRKSKYFSQKVLLIILTVITMDQTGLLFFLSQFSICQISNVQGYTLLDPNMSCSDPKYINFQNHFVYPSIIFWGVIIPLILGVTFIKSRNKIHQENYKRILGGLLNNFREDVFYWSLVIMILKLGLLMALFLIGDPRNASLIAFLLFFGYFTLMINTKPLRIEDLNRPNEWATISILVSIFLFNQGVGSSNSISIVIYEIISASSNIILLVFLGLKIFLTVKGKVKERFKSKSKSSEVKTLATDVRREMT